MHTDELKQLAVRLMAISELLEQRSEHAVEHLRKGVTQLDQSARNVAIDGRRLSAEVISAVQTEAGAAVQRGLDQALAQCREQLRSTADGAAHVTAQWQAQAQRLHREQQRLLWTGLIALTIGSLLAAGGSGYLAWHHLQQVRQARFGEDILQATRTGALTRCGQALCARIGPAPRRYGANGEYMLIRE